MKPMDMSNIREWLIKNGISEEELDEFNEARVIKDLGEGLALSLRDGHELGKLVSQLCLKVFELESEMKIIKEKSDIK